MFGAAGPGRVPDGTSLPDVRRVLDRDGTALVVDLDPLVGVALAAAASRTAHVVLVLPRWPHADAVLPCETLTATLVQKATHLSAYAGSNVLFVLDRERNKSVSRPIADPRVDNRYELGPNDLPNLQTLRAAGIQRIVKVTSR
jgi:hypothetical protein